MKRYKKNKIFKLTKKKISNKYKINSKKKKK